MNKNLLFFFLLLFLSGCYQDDAGKGFIPEKEPLLIPEEKMVEIVTDMYIAQAALKQYQDDRKPYAAYNEEFHYLIFKKHGITREEFDDAFDFYRYNLEDYDKLMEKVIENLIRLESAIQSDTIS